MKVQSWTPDFRKEDEVGRQLSHDFQPLQGVVADSPYSMKLLLLRAG